MSFPLSRWFFSAALAALLPLCGVANSAELRIAVETSTEMPMADLVNNRLVGGIHRDIGEAIARRLRRTARFELLPRKRLTQSLLAGHADLACHFLPAWLPGEFDWTQPFLPNALLLISEAQGAQPKAIEDVRDDPIGTVLGFVYPEVSTALGAGFVREDAVSSLANLRKLSAGRLRHALIGEVFLSYQQRIGAFPLRIHPPLVVHRYNAQCAVSRRGQVTAGEVNAAIDAIKHAKEIESIYQQYR
nr:ABC transporter substrate-binding protein [uncultured Roseateles sp.]